MRKPSAKFFYSAALAFCIAAGATQVQAHHSFAAEFDANAPGELKGVITEVRFSNPHVRYRVAVTKPDGTVEDWEIQAGSVTALRPQGWVVDSIKVGDSISVKGELGRNGAKKLYIRGVELADGRTFGASANTPGSSSGSNSSIGSSTGAVC